MKKAVLFMAIALLLAQETAHAYRGSFFKFNRRETLVGTIESIYRNTLVIRDEEDKRPKRFVYLLGDMEELEKGERVRIYYRTTDYFIESLKKMRFVEYKKEGQNLGIIFKRED